jgi:cell division protein FtsL
MNVGVRVLALLIAVLGSGIGVVYTKHQSRHLFIELQSLQKGGDNLAMEWELLQLEQSTLATESVVDELARTQLDMIGPAPKTVIYVAP